MQRKLNLMLIGAIALLTGIETFAATPRQDCASAAVPEACLDAKLKQANLDLNAALKAATNRIDQLQKQGERAVMSSFVNSQRQFNTYRDLNCRWQAIGLDSTGREDFIKDCQIRATLARTEELQDFVNRPPAQAAESANAPPPQPGSVTVTAAEPSVVAAEQTPATTSTPETVVIKSIAPRPTEPAPKPAPAQTAAGAPAEAGASGVKPRPNSGVDWQLQSWRVDGEERSLVEGSSIVVSFDPSGRIGGNASVNRFSGAFRFDEDGRLVWVGEGFVTTRKMGPPALMRQERMFLTALRQARKVQSEGKRLVLESASGRTELTFARD